MSLFYTENTRTIDLSEHNTIFCDSLQALEWAYKNGLPKSATIKTSAPALLWDKELNVQNIEERWTINKIEKFQSTIKQLTEHIFDASLKVKKVDRELALTISQSVYQFQKIIYKSACLKEEDFDNPRVFIYVNGKTGPLGNVMNSPWDQILVYNPLFFKINYNIENDKWNVLTTKGVSFWRRLKVAGYETIIYRLIIKLMKKSPNWLFKKEILMPNENELNIEIATSLALRGVKVSKIEPDLLCNTKDIKLDKNTVEIYSAIAPIIHARIEEWVVEPAVNVTMELFKSHLERQLKQFKLLVNGWDKVITRNALMRAVLVNSPGNIRGNALSYVCRKKNIPLISSQHGVTVEISKSHSMFHVGLDNSVADVMFSYNSKIVEIEKNTYFNYSKHYVVGMPYRLIRMKQHNGSTNKSTPQIVYISTNLYNTGFGISQKTDYGRAVDEGKLITNVLSKLPHNVRYKTYPEDNRRYADIDPVLRVLKSANNIELFYKKIDMRYLVFEHRVFITTCATSTLGWPVMSGKPVVFINQKNNSPLTDEAHASLSKGLFIFDDTENNFHRNLRGFLSQPIDVIEKLWKEKEVARKEMIREYFSAYSGGSGRRASKIIIKEYLKR
jgi:hypothetical protein